MIYEDLRKGFDLNRFDGEIGIEIETEAFEEYKIPKMSFWTGTVDPSLRGPMPYEYILRAPLKFKDELPAALEEFAVKTKKIKFDENSFTTSNHVHLNILNDSYRTLGNFFTLYALVENILVKYASILRANRSSNLFCLPLKDAEENVDNIIQVIDNMPTQTLYGLSLHKDRCKYAGLNLSSILLHGSVEVRFMGGTTDIKKIMEWTTILYKILAYARTETTPDQIVANWRVKRGKFLDEVFEEVRHAFTFEDEEQLVMQNVWYALNIALRIPDWNALKEPEVDKREDEYGIDRLDAISRMLYGSIWKKTQAAGKQYIFQNFDQLIKDATRRGYFKELKPIEPIKLENIEFPPGMVDLNPFQHAKPVDDAAFMDAIEMMKAQELARQALNDRLRDVVADNLGPVEWGDEEDDEREEF